MTSIDLIKKHEGLRLNPYMDTVGILTVGYGHNLQQPITESEADEYLNKDYIKTCWYCRQYPWYDGLNEARKAVIENMMFNLGPSRFAMFRKTIAYIEHGDFEQASFEMLNSKWAVQVKSRAVELSNIMRYGKL